MKKQTALNLVEAEYEHAKHMFPKFASRHEGYAILKEEVDELWDAIKTRGIRVDRVEAGIKQVAAMALRFLIDLC